MTALTFRTIDIPTHAAECVRFRRDSYACSFEDGLERFATENGSDGAGYLTWLAERIREFPAGCVHAWLGDRIVGQIESRLREDGSGKVNLFYLVPDVRGLGLGQQLHDHVVDVFRGAGVGILQLSVSVANQRALNFYRKLGWKDKGLRPNHPEVHNFELLIGSENARGT